jgi:hypothetical protein
MTTEPTSMRIRDGEPDANHIEKMVVECTVYAFYAPCLPGVLFITLVCPDNGIHPTTILATAPRVPTDSALIFSISPAAVSSKGRLDST